VLHVTSEVTLPPVFGLVLIKIAGYCFNTFKAIGLLLPDYYYEHAGVLVRILWEAAANLVWVAAEPISRSTLFAQFTIVERRKFIQSRLNEARRAGDLKGAAAYQAELCQFEQAFGPILLAYSYQDKKQRKKLRQRFAGSSLEDVVREIGDPWLTEYYERYPLLSFYAHASPGIVLFPNPVISGELTPEAFEIYDKPRTIQIALWSLAVMERVHLITCQALGRDDSEYFEKLEERLRFRHSLRRIS
jgi:hypothetical protein